MNETLSTSGQCSRERSLAVRLSSAAQTLFLSAVLVGCESAQDTSERMVQYGLKLAEQGRNAEAFAQFDEARRIAPKAVGPVVASAELATDLGEWDRAEREFTVAIEIDPDNVLWTEKRAEVRQLLGRHHEAKQDYTTVVERDPSRTTAWYNRGSLHAQEGDLQQAHGDIEQAISRDSSAGTRR